MNNDQLQQLAEENFPYATVDRSPEDLRIYNWQVDQRRAAYALGYTEGMQQNQTGVRWVRASERMPPVSPNQIPMKYKGKIYIGQNLYGGYLNFPFGAVGIDYDSKLVPAHLEDVEWLDESASSEVERLRKENEELLEMLKILQGYLPDAFKGWSSVGLDSLIQKIEANGK